MQGLKMTLPDNFNSRRKATSLIFVVMFCRLTVKADMCLSEIHRCLDALEPVILLENHVVATRLVVTNEIHTIVGSLNINSTTAF